ncbi:PQQ-binding-like beta-propeller repeat protein [bacterium]|nr:PQQ-binding-like beta-propeller repeat protein [bacterium]
MKKSLMGIVFYVLCFWSPGNSLVFSEDIAALIWKLSADLTVTSIAPTSDIDGDSIPDVFVGSADHLVYCLSGSVIRQGEILWSWNFGAPVWTVASIPDINRDGADDCLVGCADNTIYCMSGNPVQGLSEILWSYGVDGDIFTIAVLNDLNDDGIDDCVMGTNDDQVCCLDGAWGQVLWSYRDPAVGAIKSVSAISDVNNDGLDDCLAGGENDKVVCLSGGSTGNGDLIWYCNTQSTVLSVNTIEDVNEDNKPDCLAGGEDNFVYCISGSGSGKNDPLWRCDMGSTVKSVSSIADVNQDGIWDCLAGSESWDDNIYCISGVTGHVLWSNKLPSSVLSVCSIDDVNDSGFHDCIAGCENDRIYCLEGGQGTAIWSYETGGAVNCVVTVADLNGNLIDDVLGGSTDSYVYALDGGDILIEVVSPPIVPTGPSGEVSEGKTGNPMVLVTGGSASSFHHPVEYRFDWGDETVSVWGDSSRSHIWEEAGSYEVRAQARCALHPTVLSEWSDNVIVKIVEKTLVNRHPAEDVPIHFCLYQNYPNPFNLMTTIEYQVPKACQVTINVYSIHSHLIACIVDGFFEAGNYRINWEGRTSSGTIASSGCYIYCMKAGEYIAVKDMLLLK